MARTLFRGSDLSMATRERKEDLALFADNVELCDITENLVFSDPYFDAKLNRHTSPQLDRLVAELRADRDLKVEAQRMKHIFAAKAETLLHGDLHTGSIMVTETDSRSSIRNSPSTARWPSTSAWRSPISGCPSSRSAATRRMATAPACATISSASIVEAWSVFREEFSALWRSERTGILYQRTLFEDQGDLLASEQALDHVLHAIFEDMLGFAGVECHRRILGLAHNADFETIEDLDLRASCEAKALRFGRHILVNRRQIHSIKEVNALARLIETEKSL